MKLKFGFTIILFFLLMSNIFALDKDPFGLQGTYSCTGYDSVDGPYTKPYPIATMTYNARHSVPDRLFGAYSFKLIESDGSGYSGIGSLNGNALAIYFTNLDPKKSDDSGVGSATITRDFVRIESTTLQPVYQVKFSKFYFEPTYGGSGSHGFETCTQISQSITR